MRDSRSRGRLSSRYPRRYGQLAAPPSAWNRGQTDHSNAARSRRPFLVLRVSERIEQGHEELASRPEGPGISTGSDPQTARLTGKLMTQAIVTTRTKQPAPVITQRSRGLRILVLKPAKNSTTA